MTLVPKVKIYTYTSNICMECNAISSYFFDGEFSYLAGVQITDTTAYLKSLICPKESKVKVKYIEIVSYRS